MISRLGLLAALALVGSPPTVVVVEEPSPALNKTRVTEPIGIETPGGVFIEILHAGCAHLKQAFDIESINIDDLIATALDDPKALAPTSRLFTALILTI